MYSGNAVLLKLEQPIALGRGEATTVCLSADMIDAADSNCRTAGWGVQRPGGSLTFLSKSNPKGKNTRICHISRIAPRRAAQCPSDAHCAHRNVQLDQSICRSPCCRFDLHGQQRNNRHNVLCKMNILNGSTASKFSFSVETPRTTKEHR